MAADESVVETIRCATAKEFISNLRISDELWLPLHAREAPWLFRRQADADSPLLPSAWRQSKPSELETSAEKLRERVLGGLKESIEEVICSKERKWKLEEYKNAIALNPNIEYVLLQTIFEIKTVQLFVELVDHLGFPVPRTM